MLLLLSRCSRVWLCVTPQTAAHQALSSLGFSRQEHWSGLPFPSPMHESEKWKWSHSVVSNSSQPHGLQPTRLLCPWDFPGKSTGVGCHCLLLVRNGVLKNSNRQYLRLGPRNLCFEKQEFEKHWSGLSCFHFHLSLPFHMRQDQFLFFSKIIKHKPERFNANLPEMPWPRAASIFRYIHDNHILDIVFASHLSEGLYKNCLY